MSIIGMQNLNTPATQPGALTAADLDKEAALGAWHMLAEPLPAVETEPQWVRWIFYPAVIAITIAACFAWPLWVTP
jgi:hypothetical protein